jgi:hypothetical protein
MSILWYALFKGRLCRIRQKEDARLISESWQNGSWVTGPDFSEVDFTGRVILKEEADEYIRIRFRQKRMGNLHPVR